MCLGPAVVPDNVPLNDPSLSPNVQLQVLMYVFVCPALTDSLMCRPQEIETEEYRLH